MFPRGQNICTIGRLSAFHYEDGRLNWPNPLSNLARQEEQNFLNHVPPDLRPNQGSVVDQRSPKVQIGSRAHGFECCKMGLIILSRWSFHPQFRPTT
jgi:hypothetical protein